MATILTRRRAHERVVNELRDRHHTAGQIGYVAVCACGWPADHCQVRQILGDAGLLGDDQPPPPPFTAA